jgi:hypothetical protein
MRKKQDRHPTSTYDSEDIELEIEYICPVRGKVKQLVKGKRYPYKGTPIEPKYTINLDEIEELPEDPVMTIP